MSERPDEPHPLPPAARRNLLPNTSGDNGTNCAYERSVPRRESSHGCQTARLVISWRWRLGFERHNQVKVNRAMLYLVRLPATN